MSPFPLEHLSFVPRRSERKRRHYTEAPAADGADKPAKADKDSDGEGKEKGEGGAAVTTDGDSTAKKEENGASGEKPTRFLPTHCS